MTDTLRTVILIAGVVLLAAIVSSLLNGCQRTRDREAADAAAQTLRDDVAQLVRAAVDSVRTADLERQLEADAQATAERRQDREALAAPTLALAAQVRELAMLVRQPVAIPNAARSDARDPVVTDVTIVDSPDSDPCDELAQACGALADSTERALAAYQAEVDAQAQQLETCSELAESLRSERDLHRARAEALRPHVETLARSGLPADSGPGLYLGLGQTHIPPQFAIPYEPFARRLDAAITVAAPLRLRLPLLGTLPIAGVATASRSCQSASLTLGL
ncbi:MAG: hypothetical protein AAF170_04330 [Bacteroidota bacterium]